MWETRPHVRVIPSSSGTRPTYILPTLCLDTPELHLYTCDVRGEGDHLQGEEYEAARRSYPANCSCTGQLVCLWGGAVQRDTDHILHGMCPCSRHEYGKSDQRANQ